MHRAVDGLMLEYRLTFLLCAAAPHAPSRAALAAPRCTWHLAAIARGQCGWRRLAHSFTMGLVAFHVSALLFAWLEFSWPVRAPTRAAQRRARRACCACHRKDGAFAALQSSSAPRRRAPNQRSASRRTASGGAGDDARPHHVHLRHVALLQPHLQ
eukprot:6548306-Prymnesium_polylepis.1